MKTFIITMMLLISTTFMMAQQDSINYVTNSDIEKLVDKYSGKIEATIISLAKSLQQPAEHVYMIMIKQQYVKAGIGIFWVLLTILFISMTIRYASNIKDWDKGEVYGGKPTYSLGFCIVFAVISIVLLLFTMTTDVYTDIFQGFINPEYGAIKDIVDLF